MDARLSRKFIRVTFWLTISVKAGLAAFCETVHQAKNDESNRFHKQLDIID
jgi:hypothetical protein